MIQLKGIHHLAIICSDYDRSKTFYTAVLGFSIIREIYREERQSYKADLALNGQYIIELFSFPTPPPRPTQPEAAGLRHLAFIVADVVQAISYLQEIGVECEVLRIDAFTGKRFTFTFDPDGLPIELYEG